MPSATTSSSAVAAGASTSASSSSAGASTSAGVPVLDASLISLSRKSDPSDPELTEFGSALVRSLEDCGFAILTRHGMDTAEVVGSAVRASEAFFALPEEEKVGMFPMIGQMGFIPRGKESIDAARMDKDRPAAPYEHREAYIIDDFDRALPGDGNGDGDGDHESLGQFRATHERVGKECGVLGSRLLRSLALGLGLDRDQFYSCHPSVHPDNNRTGIRLNLYPGVAEGEALPPGSIRCGEHADFGSLTFVFQSGGLQVKHPARGWIDVGGEGSDVAGGIVVNSGLQLEIWTSGRVPASLHRVLVPEEGSRMRGAARNSLVYYFFPAPETRLAPLVGGPRREEMEAATAAAAAGGKKGHLTSGEYVTKLLKDINYF